MNDTEEEIENFDDKIINKTRFLALPFARFALFVVYFWFGVLKIFSISNIDPLISESLNKLFPLVSLVSFVVVLGSIEIVIAFLFIIPNLERLAIFILTLHLIVTAMPLFILRDATWQKGFLIPTLEGQYIIKNILVIAVAIVILSHQKTFKETKTKVFENV